MTDLSTILSSALRSLTAAAFAASLGVTSASAQSATLTVEEATRIVTPLYEALNEPAKKDVPALLAEAANPDYQSCSTNTDCLSRDQLAKVFTWLGGVIPDLKWTIEEVVVSGNQVVVRGEASGTPKGELYGVQPTGKSFKTMSIDLFTIKDGKLSRAYHIENWVGALEQIR